MNNRPRKFRNRFWYTIEIDTTCFGIMAHSIESRSTQFHHTKPFNGWRKWNNKTQSDYSWSKNIKNNQQQCTKTLFLSHLHTHTLPVFWILWWMVHRWLNYFECVAAISNDYRKFSAAVKMILLLFIRLYEKKWEEIVEFHSLPPQIFNLFNAMLLVSV